MSSEAFTGLCQSLDGPMAIVTAFDGRERSGCLVGFHTQCSIAPSRWLVCISKTNHTYGIAQRAEYLALHFLRSDQLALAQLFGSITDDIASEIKFQRCEWRAGHAGTPILVGCDYVLGRVLERTDTGDHLAHVIEITEAERPHPRAPQLGFQTVRGMQPGHPP
jgi:flavin reductase (DIM6/NTAB) family NADH-FMN oxidoreductase RutF